MLSISFGLPKFLWGGRRSAPGVKIAPVEIHEIETAAEKRSRTLKHLIKANHANHSVIYNNLRFHNHCPHILGSSYILGATSQQLINIYEEEAKTLEPWKDSPSEITQDDWRDFLGKREYQRAYLDFFEDRLVGLSYNWKQLLDEYLFGGKEPLINNLVSGLAHPLIHLGYSYELQSQTIAIEALTLAACFYSFLHKYFDDPSYTSPSTYTTTEPLDILRKIAEDKRFDGLFDSRGADNIEKLFAEREDAVLEHWNAWSLPDPKLQFEKSQEAAVSLLVGTHPSDEKFDFFVVHLLTSSHAVRILLPLIPEEWHVSLVRQWWLFTIAVYIAQLRPEIKVERINDYDLQGRNWKFVVDKAVNGSAYTDAHYVKACRAMKVASETWGDESQFYLKAAVRFADEFTNWGGFDRTGASGAPAYEV